MCNSLYHWTLNYAESKTGSPKKPKNRAQRRKDRAIGLISPLEHREEMPSPPPSRFRERLKIWSEVAAAIVTIGTIGFAVFDLLKPPQIHGQTAQASNPFSLSFSFHNQSWVFGMNDIRIDCVLKEVKTDRYWTIKEVPILEKLTIASIPPGTTGQYTCPFDKAIDVGHVETAQIVLKVKFKTFWIERDASSEVLTWKKFSRQWIEGEILN